MAPWFPMWQKMKLKIWKFYELKVTTKKLIFKIRTIKQKISNAHEEHNPTPACRWGELLTPRSISLTIWAHVPKFKILDNGNIIHERTKISTYRGIRRPIQIISSISIFGFSTVYSKENLKLENICDNIFFWMIIIKELYLW